MTLIPFKYWLVGAMVLAQAAPLPSPAENVPTVISKPRESIKGALLRPATDKEGALIIADIWNIEAHE